MRLFFALESLRDLHARSRNRELVMGRDQFKKVKRILRSVLDSLLGQGTHGLTEAQAASLERKLPDLNRPAFWEVVEDLLQRHEIQ